MKTHHPIQNLNEFRVAAFGFRLPRILLTALDLDLFTVMGTQTWTVKALAKALQASERGVDILCRNLASAGLLKKRDAWYCSETLGRTMLNAHHPEYRGQYLDLIRRQWEDWSLLTDSVKSGRPVDDQGPEDPEYRRSFTWAMHYRSMEPSKQVAKQLNLQTARSLLDIGGGPGTYAMEFLTKNPRLQAKVWDRPPALEVAKEIAGKQKCGHRLSCHAGDFLKDPVPGTFDIMWLSNVIHIYSPRENKALFRKLRAALNPHGRILIQDTFLLDRKGLYPAETNLFAVTMLLFTETGNTYGAKEVKAWLRSAGLADPKTIRLRRGTGDWEGILIEGTRPRPSKRNTRKP